MNSTGPSGREQPEAGSMDPTPESLVAEDVASAQAAVQEQVRKLSDELQSANERALRAQAELENFRNRSRREMEEERRYAALPLIGELLPVVDNLDRAISSGEAQAACDELLAGVKMVQAQFLAALERSHCQRVGQVGEPFDPHRHSALAQEPSTEHPAGCVTRVTRYGYQLHERIVRPAEVLVSTGSPAT
ncbi:MAG: nucleotide exchange factor GrpE [Pirellulaceae bacterium]